VSNGWKKIVIALALVAGTIIGGGVVASDSVQAHCYNQGHGAGGTKWC
jgi:hypothetical protein